MFVAALYDGPNRTSTLEMSSRETSPPGSRSGLFRAGDDLAAPNLESTLPFDPVSTSFGPSAHKIVARSKRRKMNGLAAEHITVRVLVDREFSL